MALREGWYLMSVRDLELELARERGEEGVPESNARPLSIPEALAYRNAGNFPDEHGRTLRLVLRIEPPEGYAALHAKRLSYEPDHLEAPRWRRPGSKPVNVVPLRSAALRTGLEHWWDDPAVGELERAWQRTGEVDGVRVPAEYRSFVYKTVLALRQAGRPVTPDTIADAVARWLPDHAEEIRAALRAANP